MTNEKEMSSEITYTALTISGCTPYSFAKTKDAIPGGNAAFNHKYN